MPPNPNAQAGKRLFASASSPQNLSAPTISRPRPRRSRRGLHGAAAELGTRGIDLEASQRPAAVGVDCGAGVGRGAGAGEMRVVDRRRFYGCAFLAIVHFSSACRSCLPGSGSSRTSREDLEAGDMAYRHVAESASTSTTATHPVCRDADRRRPPELGRSPCRALLGCHGLPGGEALPAGSQVGLQGGTDVSLFVGRRDLCSSPVVHAFYLNGLTSRLPTW